jgi:hypothetical protein
MNQNYRKLNTMKKIIISTAIAILSINLIYLTFAFMVWELDASKWEGTVRFLLVIFSLVFSGFGVGIYLSEEYHKEQKAINKNK